MKIAKFEAVCPFEIGDKVTCITETSGKVRIITDLICTHYVKSGKIQFAAELDNCPLGWKIEFLKMYKETDTAEGGLG